MSRSLNRVFLIGNVGARPEIRTTRTGTRVATFSLATSRRVRGGEDGEERTEWHRVVAWDALAEAVGRSVNRGDRLYVEGRLEYREWQDRSGRARHTAEVVAEDVIPIEGRAGRAA